MEKSTFHRTYRRWRPPTVEDCGGFSEAKAETLPPHRPIDHAIDLKPGHKLPYGQIYNLSEVELRTLKAYISR
jgi:hypothetical protein